MPWAQEITWNYLSGNKGIRYILFRSGGKTWVINYVEYYMMDY